MFLVAHVNFLALKLSRIKSAVGWGGGKDGEQRGRRVGTPASSGYHPCDMASVVGKTIWPADVLSERQSAEFTNRGRTRRRCELQHLVELPGQLTGNLQGF